MNKPPRTAKKTKIAAFPDAPLAFDVLGSPAPKGSVRAFVNRATGRAIVSPGGSKSGQLRVKAWASAVRERALELVGDRVTPPFVATALDVEIEFRMPRIAGHFGTGKHAGEIKSSAPPFPHGKPDIDKLARTTLDALTGAIFDDDSRIARLLTTKVWASPGREGASIRIAPRFKDFMSGGRDPGREIIRIDASLNRTTNAGATHASSARVRKIIAGTVFEGSLPGHAAAKHRPAQLELVRDPPPQRADEPDPEDFG